MANWCSTGITFRGDSKKLSVLENEIEKEINKDLPYHEGAWLTRLLEHIGLTPDDEKDYVSAGGYIVNIDSDTDHGYLHIDTETRWTPCLQVFVRFLEHFGLEDLGMTYLAIEEGQGIFCTNSKDYDGIWIFDTCELLPKPFDGFEYEFVEDTKLNALLSEALGKTGDTWDLASEYMEDHESVSINPIEWEEIDAWQ